MLKRYIVFAYHGHAMGGGFGGWNDVATDDSGGVYSTDSPEEADGFAKALSQKCIGQNFQIVDIREGVCVSFLC